VYRLCRDVSVAPCKNVDVPVSTPRGVVATQVTLAPSPVAEESAMPITEAKGFPAPAHGFVVTHLLIVADQDRSRAFYRDILGAEVIRERDPAVLSLSNTWLILNAGGGPTDDKPDVIAAPPQSAHVLTSALNIRVADITAVFRDWTARGAEFLTEPKDHGMEIRCYMKDPDGHLIEVGQSTGILRQHQ
jgi:lactoylglutathione lyase